MSWSSGSRLFSTIINSIKYSIPDEMTRVYVYADLIDAFEDEDCDTLDECLGTDPAFDRAYETRHICED